MIDRKKTGAIIARLRAGETGWEIERDIGNLLWSGIGVSISGRPTRSIDAAVWLTETLLPGWHWSLYDTDGNGKANAQVEPPEYSCEPHDARATGPAAALTTAALIAMLAKDGAE